MATTLIDGVYTLRKKIGQGGMAAVFLADVDLDRFDYSVLYSYTQVQGDSHAQRRARSVEFAAELKSKELDPATVRAILETHAIPLPGETAAVKICTAPMAEERFAGEWQNLLCLNHDNVVKVYGGGVHMKRPYYAMELMEGIVSPEEISEKCSIGEKLDIIIQSGRGLSYLHQNGLVHRDVKPDNAVTCRLPDGSLSVKITDLGIAKDLESDGGMTQSNATMGTPYYMSPEQLRSSRDVDHQADIYSLGASLYEFMTGKRPFHDKTTMYEIVATAHTGQRPTPPKKHDPNLPEPVSNIILTAMEPDLAKRYSSMADLVKDLETYVSLESREVLSGNSFASAALAKEASNLGKGHYVFEKMRRKAVSTRGSGKSKSSRKKTSSRKKRTTTRKKPVPTGLSNMHKALIGGGAGVLLLAIALISAFSGPEKKPVASTKPTASKPKPRRTKADWRSTLEKADKAYSESKLREAIELYEQASEQMTADKKADKAVLRAMTAHATKHSGQARFILDRQSLPVEGQIKATQEKLKELNPGYDGKGKFLVADGRITEINLWDCSIRDLSPLRGLKPTLLDFRMNQVSDLSPLRGMPLKRLNCYKNPVADLSLLKKMKLEWLDISYSSVTDLTPLKDMPLATLVCQYSHVADLSPLRKTPLTALLCVGSQVVDLTPLSGMKLKSLAFSPEKITRGISAIREMESIGKIGLASARQMQPREFWKRYDAGEFGKPVAVASPGLSTDPARLHAALKAVNPDYNGEGAFKVEGGKIVEVKFIRCGLRDLTPLKDMPLVKLTMVDCKLIRDISPLKGMPLKRLRLVGCTQVTDISALKGMPLDYLSLDRSLVPDISVLKGMPLTELDLGQCRSIRDLSPLSSMSLKWLSLYGCSQVSDISFLRGMPLTSLTLAGCKDVRDITVLRGMPLRDLEMSGTRVDSLVSLKDMRIERLTLWDTRVRDLTPLRGMPLVFLSIANCAGITDLGPLAGMNLKELHFMPQSITQGMAIVRNMKSIRKLNTVSAAEFWKRYDAGEFGKPVAVASPELSTDPARLHAALKAVNPEYSGKGKFKVEGGNIVEVDLGRCGVRDLTPLRKLPLKRVVAFTNPLASIAALQGMDLIHLDVSGCEELSDLSPLRGMRLKSLWIDNTKVSDISSLRGMPIRALGLSRTQVTSLTVLDGMPLENLALDAGKIKSGLQRLRAMKTIVKIGPSFKQWTTPAEFWKKYDAGEFKESAAQNPDLAIAAYIYKGRLKPQLKLESLSTSREAQAALRTWASSPQGLYVFSGPRGSGKTTILASVLSRALRGEVTIMSIESARGEPSLSVFGKVTKQTTSARTAAELIQSLHAAKPDAVITCELVEPASLFDATAMQALLELARKHLVFGQIHLDYATDAPRWFVRHGGNPSLVGEVLKGLENSRLVKRRRGGGRLALMEAITLTPALQALIKKDVTPAQLREAAVKEGMITLRADGDRKVKSRAITQKEVDRVLGPAPEAAKVTQKKAVTPEQLHAALRRTNPQYTGKGRFDVEDGKIVRVHLGGCMISDLSALRGLPLQAVNAFKNPLRSLTPLKGMALERLDLCGTLVEDFSVLKGMPLEKILFHPKFVKKGLSTLRRCKTLKRVAVPGKGEFSAKEFWKKCDAGEFGPVSKK